MFSSRPRRYDYFAANGKWPDKTMFVLEVYGSTFARLDQQAWQLSNGMSGLDVEVKDESRFADKWAYFNFSETAKTRKRGHAEQKRMLEMP